MRKIALAAVFAAAMGVALTANAETLQGTIVSYDAASQQVMLESGQAFRLQAGIDTTMLTQGAQVTLNVEQIGGEQVVTGIEMN